MLRLEDLEKALKIRGENPSWAGYILQTQKTFLEEYGLDVVIEILRGGARGFNRDNPQGVKGNYAGSGEVLDIEFFNLVVSMLDPEFILELKVCADFSLFLQIEVSGDLWMAGNILAQIGAQGIKHEIVQKYFIEKGIKTEP